MSVIFLFIDGIGLGMPDRDNPLVDLKWEAFERMTGGEGLHAGAGAVRGENLCFFPVDANLGMEGLPQSGTGQAAMLTGRNAARLAGRHFGPFPHSSTRFLLKEESLFHQAIRRGFIPHFINAYPELFFEKMKSTDRWTCTTLMASSAGQKLNGIEEVRNGNSITAEIIQEAWRDSLNLDVEQITPEEAADRLISASGSYDLIMYEYYLTDKAGHSRDLNMSRRVLEILNRFMVRILEQKEKSTTVVLCSDHGNLEDLSVKTHTRNRVPLLIYGPGAHKIESAGSIMDLPSTILKLLE